MLISDVKCGTPAPDSLVRVSGWKRRLRVASHWSRREDGTMTILGLFVFVTMLLVAGIAVDVMRMEHERVRMQGATDRAVVAATMLRTNVSGATPEQIVRVFLAAEGLEDHLVGGIQERALPGGREVTVTPAARIPSTFMRMLGVNEVVMSTPAVAVEALTRLDFEIVLVLDVSGSMMHHNRIENLRTAALDFATSMLGAYPRGQVGLTIVPYSTEVILPPAILNSLPDLTIPPGLAEQMATNPNLPTFCIEFGNWPNVRAAARAAGSASWHRRRCDLRSNTDFQMPLARPYMHDIADVEAYLNSLGPVWGTSIDLGVQTGALFFDPTLRSGIETMIANGTVHPDFAGRPYSFDRSGVYRAMILMTDGENCCFHPGHEATRHPNLEIQDAFTENACGGLRDNGVTIYGIAFEAPPGGVEMMRRCASSENHFFNTSAGGVIGVFQGISTHIQTQALRLVQ